MRETGRLVDDLATDVQALSHRLHSSKLDYLGLVSASRGFCRELSDRQDVTIAFTSHDVPRNVPREVMIASD